MSAAELDLTTAKNKIEALETEMRAFRNLTLTNLNIANDFDQCRLNELRLAAIRKESLEQLQFWRKQHLLLAAKLELLKTVAETPIKTSYILCKNACGASFSSDANHIAHEAVCENKPIKQVAAVLDEPKKVTIDETKNAVAVFNKEGFDRVIRNIADYCMQKPSPKKRRRCDECALDGAYWTTTR